MLFEEALERLKSAKLTSLEEMLGEPPGKEISAKDIREIEVKLGVRVPVRWEKVLLTRNGGHIYSETETADVDLLICPVQSILATTLSNREDAVSRKRSFSMAWITIAHNANNSEFIVLDTSRATPDGDAPLLQISHAGGLPEDRWSCIADFLEYAVSGQIDPGAREELERQNQELKTRQLEMCKTIIAHLIDGRSFNEIDSLMQAGGEYDPMPFMLMILSRNAVITVSEIRAGKAGAYEEFVERGNEFAEQLLSLATKMYEGKLIGENVLKEIE